VSVARFKLSRGWGLVQLPDELTPRDWAVVMKLFEALDMPRGPDRDFSAEKAIERLDVS
jgi:hypothetical protein